MKTNIIRISFTLGLLLFLIACSTRKDTWLSRNSHALSTKYNILYNGGLALDAGVNDLKTSYGDNFWEVLPVERMQPVEEVVPEQDVPKLGNGQAAASPRNPNFDRAETKATKAIQKHSMNIGGAEKNPQMDEAHLMLGKARYYDQRFIPALEAFNYVLYKYPKSSKIYEVKVWREKTNMRLENDGLAITNLRKLLKEIKFKDQIFADANATLAQAFINTQEKDSAIAKLKLAAKFTKQSEETARYRFIIAQLFEQTKQNDSAFAYFQQVIDMKRQSPRMYVIQAHARQAAQFDFVNGDTLVFTEKFNKLLADRENRPYLDVLNHQMGLFYDKKKLTDNALKYYNKSLNQSPKDAYLNASNYRNIGEIYFNRAKYVKAGAYYDSTLVHLKPRTREFRLIEKKRLNLEDVIKYEGIAQTNDSIINVWSMSGPARIAYYDEYISRLKKEDELRRIAAEKEKQRLENLQNSKQDVASSNNLSRGSSLKMASASADQSSIATNKMAVRNAKSNSNTGEFYFYNATTVAFGKSEFRKNWGNRDYQENWRFAKSTGSNANSSSTAEEVTSKDGKTGKMPMDGKEVADVRYTPDFYISKLPKTQPEIDSLAKDRNFAYYQLGVIYKEKFKEYERAADKLEKLLQGNPEERLVLPAKYNLYKIYEIINKDKAAAMKDEIVSQYPESRYAQILGNTHPTGDAAITPEVAYGNLFKEYESREYVAVLPKLQQAIDQYTGEEMVPKFELLKARTIGKLRGIAEYRKALNYVALTYPNSSEGKESELLLGRDVVLMEYMQFNDTEPKSWKILYYAPNPEDKNIKILQEKIKKFASERTADQLSQSLDLYTENMNFVVIHGMKSEETAKGIASVLKEFKEYKIKETPIIISTNNYEVVQIKKNLEEYLADPNKPAEKRAPPAIKSTDKPQKGKSKIGPREQKKPKSGTGPGTSNPKGGDAPKGGQIKPPKDDPDSFGGKKTSTSAVRPPNGTTAPKK